MGLRITMEVTLWAYLWWFVKNDPPPPRLIDLNTWSPESALWHYWKGSGSVALLEGVGWALRSQKDHAKPRVLFSLSLPMNQDAVLSYCSRTMLPAMRIIDGLNL